MREISDGDDELRSAIDRYTRVEIPEPKQTADSYGRWDGGPVKYPLYKILLPMLGWVLLFAVIDFVLWSAAVSGR